MAKLSGRTVMAFGLGAALLVAAGCAPGGTGSPSPSAEPATSAPATSAPPATEPPAPTTAPSPTEAPPVGGIIDPSTPTGCISLAPEDCARARAFAATVLTGDDPPVTYVQVGPFGCSAGDPCPETFLSRPEGDVVLELAGGVGVNVHLVVEADGSFEAVRTEGMGIALPPASARDGQDGARLFQLGHCGIFSGMDVDGSYWDPVGPISFATGEAVNETSGVLTLTGPDRATFTAPRGFTVQLVRHDGPKFLPFCM